MNSKVIVLTYGSELPELFQKASVRLSGWFAKLQETQL